MARPASDARQRALTAALTIAQRDGAAALTIDAVAREARLSKGGVLHHFPSKEALVLAMVERLVLEFEAATLVLAEADRDPIGRYTRAFLTAMSSPTITAAGRALLAVVAVDPGLLDPLRASYKRCYERLARDGIDPVDAHVCQLVADALWMNAVFGLPDLPPEVVRSLERRLLALTRRPRRRR
jgi:AcrR family transcriptional regulator